MGKLDGKIVLITGANRGIGRAIAGRFLREGGRLVLTVRSEAAIASLSAEMAGREASFAIEPCDIAEPTQVAALAARVRATVPRIDVLVNNAAVYLDEDRVATADRLDLAALRRTLEVNLFGTIALTQAVVESIPRGGRIVNLSSTMGQLSNGLESSSLAYSLSKTALNAFTSSLAAALQPRGILVDSLHPGWVKTAMGGPGAQRDAGDAAADVLFLATRPDDGRTGRFWRGRDVIPW
ncbi:MAG: SDR family NAD(P)-dependent oxidoreductase [Vulcanimicrobiaceae bacterium]